MRALALKPGSAAWSANTQTAHPGPEIVPPLCSSLAATCRIQPMRYPSYSALMLQPLGQANSYARNMHPNPSFYKYLSWVFWSGSPCDGPEFLVPKHAIGTAEAMCLTSQLMADGEAHWIYNRRIPRLVPGTSFFDLTAAKWQGISFACAMETDPDKDWHGFR